MLMQWKTASRDVDYQLAILLFTRVLSDMGTSGFEPESRGPKPPSIDQANLCSLFNSCLSATVECMVSSYSNLITYIWVSDSNVRMNDHTIDYVFDMSLSNINSNHRISSHVIPSIYMIISRSSSLLNSAFIPSSLYFESVTFMDPVMNVPSENNMHFACISFTRRIFTFL